MVTVAREQSPRGEVVLRRRDHDGAVELRVNGAFVMDDQDTGTEQALARLALESVRRGADVGELAVLVAGLGLGFTLAEVLTDSRVGRVLVVELEPALVEWHRGGVVPGGDAALADPRVEVAVADIATLLPDLPGGSFDVVLLDVDNGPEFLVYESNATLYRPGFLTECHRMLAAGGVLAVWSSTPAEPLAADLTEVFGGSQVIDLPVRLGARPSTYRVLLGTRDESQRPAAPG